MFSVEMRRLLGVLARPEPLAGHDPAGRAGIRLDALDLADNRGADASSASIVITLSVARRRAAVAARWLPAPPLLIRRRSGERGGNRRSGVSALPPGHDRGQADILGWSRQAGVQWLTPLSLSRGGKRISEGAAGRRVSLLELPKRRLRRMPCDAAKARRSRMRSSR